MMAPGSARPRRGPLLNGPARAPRPIRPAHGPGDDGGPLPSRHHVDLSVDHAPQGLPQLLPVVGHGPDSRPPAHLVPTRLRAGQVDSQSDEQPGGGNRPLAYATFRMGVTDPGVETRQGVHNFFTYDSHKVRRRHRIRMGVVLRLDEPQVAVVQNKLRDRKSVV